MISYIEHEKRVITSGPGLPTAVGAFYAFYLDLNCSSYCSTYSLPKRNARKTETDKIISKIQITLNSDDTIGFYRSILYWPIEIKPYLCFSHRLNMSLIELFARFRFSNTIFSETIINTSSPYALKLVSAGGFSAEIHSFEYRSCFIPYYFYGKVVKKTSASKILSFVERYWRLSTEALGTYVQDAA